uniref:Uncharacterized protein n=1 Tax=Tetranychus urticae TaxID=32264 RepID=T1K094_TETUR
MNRFCRHNWNVTQLVVDCVKSILEGSTKEILCNMHKTIIGRLTQTLVFICC